jgi:hypothetical protein
MGKGEKTYIPHSLGEKRFTPASIQASIKFFCTVPSTSCVTIMKLKHTSKPLSAATRLGLSL